MNQWRINFVFFLIVAIAISMAGRIFYLQVVKGGYYAAIARGQHAEQDDAILRGEIFFKDNFNASSGFARAAATNKDWFLLYAVPSEIEDAERAASRIASLLYSANTRDLKKEELYKKFKDRDDPYVPIKNRLEEHVVNGVKELGIAGIYLTKEKLRYYPAGDLASHVIGFLGYREDERVGQYGVEGFYDREYLKKGKSLLLSIDYNIQFALHEILKDAKDNLNAEGASGIVIDPKTGEIMALVVIDEFNLNSYSEVDDIDIFLNDITQKIFEPGSIFKPFTMAAALDSNRVSPSSTYEDKGKVKISGYTIRNSDGKSYGVQTMTNVLEKSLNTGAVYVANILGHDKFREYITNFGFDDRVGVDMQGEVPGDIRNIMRTTRDINLATAAFGQGIALTPLQIVSAFSAFANGGKMARPHIVNGIIDIDGSEKKIPIEIIGEPVSSKTAAQMTAMLVSVVENGYGRKAAVPGYEVAGKTGTAQVPKEDGRGYHEDKTIHSFIGYAPAYEPRFLILLKLDNPQGINFSADSVAPLFSDIAEYILNYYEIPPGA